MQDRPAFIVTEYCAACGGHAFFREFHSYSVTLAANQSRMEFAF